MVVCKFYLQGNCKFGTRCRYEHPREEHTFQSKNRFSALQGDDRLRASNPGRRAQDYPYNLDPSILEKDLRYELPTWIFSCYGPGSNAPRQLFGSFPLEQSSEEMRTMYYLGMATGNVDQAVNAERELACKSHRHIQEVLNDPDGAIRYVAAGAKLPDNRWEVCNRYRGSSIANQTGASSSTTTMNQKRPEWTGSDISENKSRPHQGQTFGRPSPLAQGGGTFGQPSALGQGPSSFGKPSGIVQGGLFSQPNQQHTKPDMGQISSFGRPSTFGQISAFAQPSTGPSQTQDGAFNQLPYHDNQFQSGFTNTQSQFAQSTSQVSLGPGGSNSNGGFAQSSGFGSNNNHQPSNNGFGSGFGSGSTIINVSTQNQSQPQNISAPFAKLHPNSLVSPSLSTYTTHNPPIPPNSNSISNSNSNSKLTTFHNHPVKYISNIPYYTRSPSHGLTKEEKFELERIWFPDGPPAREARRIETMLDDHTTAAGTVENNHPSKSTVLKEAQDAYVHLAMNDAFKDGIMPEIAPRWEWIRWDM